MAYQGLDVGNYFRDQRDRDYLASQSPVNSLFSGGRRKAASAEFGSALSGLQSGLQDIGGNSTVGIRGLTSNIADQYNAESELGQSALGSIAKGIALDKEIAFAEKLAEERESRERDSQKGGGGFGKIAGGILGTVISGGNPIGGAIGSGLGSLLPF
jgi:hypothetical protein